MNTTSRNISLSIDNIMTEINNIKTKVEKPRYEICEIYCFRNPILREGFVPATGGIVSDAINLYPKAYQFLQSTDGQRLCITEEEWQTMSTAIYYTNRANVSEGWGGVGGVPYFVVNTNDGTIRVPDVRGMYMETAGLDSFDVGSVHADGTRRMYGSLPGVYSSVTTDANGCFTWQGYQGYPSSVQGQTRGGATFESSLLVPTSNHIEPRAFGVLACVYLGI